MKIVDSDDSIAAIRVAFALLRERARLQELALDAVVENVAVVRTLARTQVAHLTEAARKSRLTGAFAFAADAVAVARTNPRIA